MSNEIREKLWNINKVVEDIKLFPQTYKTILKELSDDGTCQIILRRKLNNLIKEGIVCKATIPGTRFGKVIFYTFPKNYHILVEGTRVGSKVYCFYEFERLNKFYILVTKYWMLKDGRWNKYYRNKKFFGGNVLKWI